jgi:hypothetical protein
MAGSSVKWIGVDDQSRTVDTERGKFAVTINAGNRFVSNFSQSSIFCMAFLGNHREHRPSVATASN